MRTGIVVLAAVALITVVGAPAIAADDSKVKAATDQVATGAKKIGSGEVIDGVADTAKGIAKTVEESAKYTGEKFKEAGKAAEPEATSAGRNIRDSAVAFARSVKGFFTKLFE
jgi:hypothetical protein